MSAGPEVTVTSSPPVTKVTLLNKLTAPFKKIEEHFTMEFNEFIKTLRQKFEEQSQALGGTALKKKDGGNSKIRPPNGTIGGMK